MKYFLVILLFISCNSNRKELPSKEVLNTDNTISIFKQEKISSEVKSFVSSYPLNNDSFYAILFMKDSLMNDMYIMKYGYKEQVVPSMLNEKLLGYTLYEEKYPILIFDETQNKKSSLFLNISKLKKNLPKNIEYDYSKKSSYTRYLPMWFYEIEENNNLKMVKKDSIVIRH